MKTILKQGRQRKYRIWCKPTRKNYQNYYSALVCNRCIYLLASSYHAFILCSGEVSVECLSVKTTASQLIMFLNVYTENESSLFAVFLYLFFFGMFVNTGGQKMVIIHFSYLQKCLSFSFIPFQRVKMYVWN